MVSSPYVVRTLIVLLLGMPAVVHAQVGGERSFEFQNVPMTPRLTGLGGIVVSLPDEDLSLVYSNPALTSDTLSGLVAFNYLSYFADVNVTSFVYQHDFGTLGSWFMGVNHFSYGEFEGRDEAGAPTSNFDASETLVTLGRSHRVGNFTVGGSFKFIHSALAEFDANVLALDIGGSFKHPQQQLSVGLVFKNIGLVVSDYTESSDSKLPFDIQLGTSFKPEHMPFRFTLTAYNLYKGDIAYFNPNDPSIVDEPGTADKVLRHFSIGGELLLSKNVNVRVGYNHLVRQELKLEETAGGAGFSYGIMFRIKAFEFSYSRGGYHPAGGSHNFGLVVNTNKFLKKDNKI